MKKVIVLILAVAMILSTFTACAQQAAPETAAAPAATEEASAAVEAAATEAPAVSEDLSTVSLVFATDQVGSGGYNYGIEMAKYMEKDGGFASIEVQPISPGSMGAAYLFMNDQADLAFVCAAPAKWAKDTGVLDQPPATGYMAVAGGLTATLNVCLFTNAFMEKYNVTTIEEAIRQKLPIRMASSPAGSMDYQGIAIILEYLGVTKEDIESWGGSWVTGSGADNNARIKDGEVDFYLDHTSPSSSNMAEIAMTNDVTFLQWEDATVEWAVNVKGYQRVTLPANSFKGQTEDIVNPGSPDSLFCKESLTVDEVYALTKALCENRDAIVAAYAAVEPFDPATAWDPEKIGGLELHPGAAKYYKEMGYMN